MKPTHFFYERLGSFIWVLSLFVQIAQDAAETQQLQL